MAESVDVFPECNDVNMIKAAYFEIWGHMPDGDDNFILENIGLHPGKTIASIRKDLINAGYSDVADEVSLGLYYTDTSYGVLYEI